METGVQLGLAGAQSRFLTVNFSDNIEWPEVYAYLAQHNNSHIIAEEQRTQTFCRECMCKSIETVIRNSKLWKTYAEYLVSLTISCRHIKMSPVQTKEYRYTYMNFGKNVFHVSWLLLNFCFGKNFTTLYFFNSVKMQDINNEKRGS